MAGETATTLMTADQFVALPVDENVTQELIDGELRERDMATRNPKHSLAIARISQFLGNWLDKQSEIIGAIVAGEVRCRLSTNPNTIVGIDVAMFAGAEAIRQSQQETFFEGAPLIAVEVLSPSDTYEDISDKIRRYLSNGSSQVWIADPDFRTITVHRTDNSPKLYNAEQTLDGNPELAGFQVQVGRLFGLAVTSQE